MVLSQIFVQMKAFKLVLIGLALLSAFEFATLCTPTAAVASMAFDAMAFCLALSLVHTVQPRADDYDRLTV